ncbi:MAG: YtxH domain-containing protein [Acidobacteria bacterium]|nr:YtxH domain-containing protein [Acidobacteriota bacterium]
MDDNKLSYFLFGLGMGVAIGVLFAPKSGQETRETLKSKASEGRDYLRRRGEEVLDSTTEILNRGKGVFQTQKEQLASALEAGKQAYRQATATGQPSAPEGTTGG